MADVVIEASDAAIVGDGRVESVAVSANNVQINTKGTKVTVSGNVSGVTSYDALLQSGKTTVTGGTLPESSASSASDGGGSGADTVNYTVTLNANGGNCAASVSVAKGAVISDALPTPKKSGYVFSGWYTDEGLTVRLSTTITASENLTLYAKYVELSVGDVPLSNYFTLMDQKSDLTIALTSTDSSMTSADVQRCLTLTITGGTKTASDIGFTVEGSNASYTVKATSGFEPGVTYTMTLNSDALSFYGQSDAVRTCNFSIKAEESYQLATNSA